MSDPNRYVYLEQVHNFSASREVLPVVFEKTRPGSVIDIGCGVGTWLSVAKELGIPKVVGVDGPHVNALQLKIPENEFVVHDLRKPLPPLGKFDLCICLEVAEHIEERYADAFVSDIVNHADVVLFSAAIPGQEGQYHLNEQWHQYWLDKFTAHGFGVLLDLRPLFWNNDKIEWWYRQNMFLLSRNGPPGGKVNSYIHPTLHTIKEKQLRQYQDALACGESVGFYARLLAKRILISLGVRRK